MKASLHCALLAAALGGCEKYELDRQMNELCAKDGGVRVYETVTLSPEMFDPNGRPFPPALRKVQQDRVESQLVSHDEILGTQYRLRSEVLYLKKGNPVKGEGVLMRFHERVIRDSDGKTLGEAVSYGRSGGDFIALGHFTSNGCPVHQGSNAATRAVFIKGGK